MSDNILIRVRSYMGAGVDLSRYYNKTEVDDKIQEQSERLADDIANNANNINNRLNEHQTYYKVVTDVATNNKYLEIAPKTSDGTVKTYTKYCHDKIEINLVSYQSKPYMVKINGHDFFSLEQFLNARTINLGGTNYSFNFRGHRNNFQFNNKIIALVDDVNEVATLINERNNYYKIITKEDGSKWLEISPNNNMYTRYSCEVDSEMGVPTNKVTTYIKDANDSRGGSCYAIVLQGAELFSIRNKPSNDATGGSIIKFGKGPYLNHEIIFNSNSKFEALPKVKNGSSYINVATVNNVNEAKNDLSSKITANADSISNISDKMGDISLLDIDTSDNLVSAINQVYAKINEHTQDVESLHENVKHFLSLGSDDVNLDQLGELVKAIKDNDGAIEGLLKSIGDKLSTAIYDRDKETIDADISKLKKDVPNKTDKPTFVVDRENTENVNITLETNHVYTYANPITNLNVTIDNVVNNGYVTEINYCTGNNQCAFNLTKQNSYDIEIVLWGRIVNDYTIPANVKGSILVCFDGQKITLYVSEIRR